MVPENSDFAQRCCQCGRTESWEYVGFYRFIRCACGHEVCGDCQPFDTPEAGREGEESG